MWSRQAAQEEQKREIGKKKRGKVSGKKGEQPLLQK
jgi:hypothetical protein